MPGVYAFLWIAQGWSLGIELVFYLLAPFVARTPWRLAALVVIGLVSRYVTYRIFQQVEDPWYYRFVISEMMLFGLGGLGYHVYARFPKSDRRIHLLGAGTLVVAFIIVGFRFILGPLQPVFETGFLPLMLWDPATLLFMALFVSAIFAFARTNAFDRLLGDLSYPVYLSHVGIAAALSLWTGANPLVGNLVYVTAILGVSAALIVFIDRPITKFRARRLGAQHHRAPIAPRLAVQTS
jgi:peptidoglycan/LPS O-acetylase OafA/YrhL